MSEVFEELLSVNVNDHVEVKDNGRTKLSYLSWSFAWAETKKRYPNAQYEIKKNDKGLPYVYDELTGFMVYTSVTIEGITHEMWLPVMDGNNKAMKAQPYTYTTRYGEKTVEAATMFDINKAIMRCLVKNLAMFGLGLYIYAGEDLPITEDSQKTVKADNEVEYAKARTRILKYVNSRNNVEACEKWICDKYKVNKSAELTYEQSLNFIKTMESKGEAI